MNKRGYSDSDEDRNSSSDEDDGNFKRRRRSSGSEDFVTKTLQSFVTPEVSKPKAVVKTQEEIQLIQKQKVLNTKLSKLPKYDDLFDNASEDCSQIGPKTEEFCVDSAVDSSLQPKDESLTTTIEVASDAEADPLAGGDSAEGLQSVSSELIKLIPFLVSKPKTNDPRLRRLEKFKTPEVEPPPRLSKENLLRKVNDLLNSRKPYDAYHQLKGEVNSLELHKYVELLMVMAKDWFASQIDTSYDPRAVFIEMSSLNSFSTLLKDLFSTKIKSKEFWESIIFGIEKFVDESRIKELVIHLIFELSLILCLFLAAINVEIAMDFG